MCGHGRRRGAKEYGKMKGGAGKLEARICDKPALARNLLQYDEDLELVA